MDATSARHCLAGFWPLPRIHGVAIAIAKGHLVVFRFTIRDLPWLTAVVALAVAMWSASV